jgi:hypothetical protein
MTQSEIDFFLASAPKPTEIVFVSGGNGQIIQKMKNG